ncbi:MAG: MBL fold metallo-hydrolase [Alphaproteobacteria bacterium]|jgi:L-ascorbate metabolism protein UlaG (beta-lactamase superfamily)
MSKFTGFLCAGVLAVGFMASSNLAVAAGNVTITSLGSHDGELCRRDRAMVLEDPNGTRVLYDPGRTVMGPKDPRLGKIDLILLSSMHADHLGDKRGSKVNAGTCKKPKLKVKTVKYSNTVDVAVGTKAKVISGGEMHYYLGNRTKKAGGNKKSALVLRHGGKRTIKGVRVSIIPALHSNGLGSKFMSGDAKKLFASEGLAAYAGPESGFVVTFTNGLTVYLSGDTGHHANMDTLVRRYYKAKVAIMHMGDVYTMGPEEAAWAVNELIKPTATIPVHANEASTKGGKLQSKSRVAKFKKLIKGASVHIATSGKAMQFDG